MRLRSFSVWSTSPFHHESSKIFDTWGKHEAPANYFYDFVKTAVAITALQCELYFYNQWQKSIMFSGDYLLVNWALVSDNDMWRGLKLAICFGIKAFFFPQQGKLIPIKKNIVCIVFIAAYTVYILIEVQPLPAIFHPYPSVANDSHTREVSFTNNVNLLNGSLNRTMGIGLQTVTVFIFWFI